jgi:DNA-binding response OmpR family regulator
MHALIIEDESLIAVTIEGILRDCGFTSFDIAVSNEEAIEAVRLRCPRLITADVELRPGNGIDAVNAICTGPAIPVIFITGSLGQVTSRMPDHPIVTKPFSNDAILTAVSAIFRDSERAKS